MNYTIQLWTDSGSFRAPSPTDIVHCKSKKEILAELEQWKEQVERLSSERIFALVWFKELDDVQDIYPDAEATLISKECAAILDWLPEHANTLRMIKV